MEAIRILSSDVLASDPSRAARHNQGIYQRLKLALQLGLRRQIFMAVCDDANLRDRIADRLHADLNALERSQDPLPQFVSLELNLEHPDPADRISKWLTRQAIPSFPQQPRVRSTQPGNKLTGFQMLGIERLTRESADRQWFFLNSLRAIDRKLSPLACNLLLWLNRPWFLTVRESVPEFWRSCTGVFEFASEPTPCDRVEGSDRAQRVDAFWLPPETEKFSPQIASETIISTPADKVSPASDLPEDSDRVAALGEEDSGFEENLGEEIAAFEMAKDAPSDVEITRAPPSDLPETDAGRAIVTPERFPRLDGDWLARVRDLPAEIVVKALPLLEKLDAAIAADAGVEIAAACTALGDWLSLPIRKAGETARGSDAIAAAGAAIFAYRQALDRPIDDPERRAELLNDIGTLHWSLARSTADAIDRCVELQRGIQAYGAAIAQIPDSRPDFRAMVQNNVGALYGELGRYHEPAKSWQAAAIAYCEALEYLRAGKTSGNRDRARQYAATQNNLGTAYWNLAQHQQPRANVRHAIAAYEEALQFFSPEVEPLNYGMLQNNLGTAYWNLSRYEEPEENLQRAIAAYGQALRFRTPEANPAACSATQNNLGTACWHLAGCQEDANARAASLHQAIAAYEVAIALAEKLSGREPLAFDPLAARNNLGLACYQLATDPQPELEAEARKSHLEAALHHHARAYKGRRHQPKFQKAALDLLVQTVRAFHDRFGVAGQNAALEQLPSEFLPDIFPRL